MIEEIVAVTSVQDAYVWVHKPRVSGCNACASKSECGTSAISKVVGTKYTQVKALNQANANVGDTVVIALHESTLLNLSLLAYLMPLILLVSGTLGFSLFDPNSQWLAITGAFIGFLTGVVLLKCVLWFKRDQAGMIPTVTKVLESKTLDLFSICTL